MSDNQSPYPLLHSPPTLDVQELTRFTIWLVVGALAGALVAMALSFALSPRWETVVLVRPGQLTGVALPPSLVESPARVAERMNSHAFAELLKQRMGLPSGRTNPDSRLIDASFRATALDRSALVQLKVQGYSTENAQRAAEAALSILENIHGPMYESTVNRLVAKRHETHSDLERLVAERDRLLQTMNLLPTSARASERFSENALLNQVISDRETAIWVLRKRAATLDEQLAPEHTYPTGAIDRILVPELPAFPRKSILAVGGAVLGAMLGALGALWWRWKR